MKFLYANVGLLIILLMLNFALDLELRDHNKELKTIITAQATQIRALEVKVVKPIEVTVTAYSPTVMQTDSSPYITAFNKKVKPGTIAVSRDLFLAGWTPGRKVYIYQIGVFEIADLMHRRKSNHLDIFFWTRDQAIQFGVKKSRAILLDI